MKARIEAVEIEGVLSVIPAPGEPMPLVFDSPHSGLLFPEEFKPAVPRELVLLASDTYVDSLFSFAPGIGAACLFAHFPRSYMDVNRSLLDMDIELVEGVWPHAIRDSAVARRGMGLVWRYAWGGTPMYSGPLAVAELEGRIHRYWWPYHRNLKSLLDALYELFGCVYHVNCHSMPASGHALSPDPPGVARPDFVLGDNLGTSCTKAFVDLAGTVLRGFGYSVAVNVPFKGAELITAYSDPSRHRNSLQIEINRRLYMDETTRERSDGYEKLAGDLRLLGEALCQHAVANIPP